MNENIKLLLQKLAEDSELAAKMQNFRNPDEAYEFASGIQEGFTKEEFFDAMKAIDAAQKGELSDEDLARIAGGKDDDGLLTFLEVATSIVSSIGAAAAYAAI